MVCLCTFALGYWLNSPPRKVALGLQPVSGRGWGRGYISLKERVDEAAGGYEVAATQILLILNLRALLPNFLIQLENPFRVFGGLPPSTLDVGRFEKLSLWRKNVTLEVKISSWVRRFRSLAVVEDGQSSVSGLRYSDRSLVVEISHVYRDYITKRKGFDQGQWPIYSFRIFWILPDWFSRHFLFVCNNYSCRVNAVVG